MPLKFRKLILLTFIALTYVVIIAEFTPLNSTTQAVGFIGKLTGLCGALLLTWQFILGIRGLIVKFIPDLIWIKSVHKFLGTYGFVLILFHPIFISIYYTNFGVNMFSLDFTNPFNFYKFFGVIAISLLGLVWVLSAFFRTRIGFRTWKRIHFSVYIILPLVLYHSSNIGSDVHSGFLSYYWKILVYLYILIVFYGILSRLGVLKQEYVIAENKEVTKDVHKITLKPEGVFLSIIPKPGQFIYIQPGPLRENHPFTVSHYDPVTKFISITPKASGPFSTKIQSLQPGASVFIDGPYGVFTKEAYETEKPVVLIVGGIGITPFLRLIEKFKTGWDKKVILFYANKTMEEAVYVNEITEAGSFNANFKLVNVISEDPNFAGEKGRINTELLKKYLVNGSDTLLSYEFFVCGPPPMIKAINSQLKESGVNKEQIHFELFSL